MQHDRLTRICHVDYDREMALVAVRSVPETGEDEIVAVGRLSRMAGTKEAEFALLVRDQFQGRGLGSEILRRLLDIGRDEGVRRVFAYIMNENLGMRHICKQLGFQFKREAELVKAAVEL